MSLIVRAEQILAAVEAAGGDGQIIKTAAVRPGCARATVRARPRRQPGSHAQLVVAVVRQQQRFRERRGLADHPARVMAFPGGWLLTCGCGFVDVAARLSSVASRWGEHSNERREDC